MGTILTVSVSHILQRIRGERLLRPITGCQKKIETKGNAFLFFTTTIRTLDILSSTATESAECYVQLRMCTPVSVSCSAFAHLYFANVHVCLVPGLSSFSLIAKVLVMGVCVYVFHDLQYFPCRRSCHEVEFGYKGTSVSHVQRSCGGLLC